MHQLIEGLHGVKVVADELVIVGFGDTEENALVMTRMWMLSCSGMKRED